MCIWQKQRTYGTENHWLTLKYTWEKKIRYGCQKNRKKNPMKFHIEAGEMSVGEILATVA